VRASAWLVAGFLSGAAAAAATSALTSGPIAGGPVATIGNGVLTGWEVTKDAEILVCDDPVIFIRARQIECP
jgi:hypothetical protein